MGYYWRSNGNRPIVFHACGLVPHSSGQYVTGLERSPQSQRNTMWPELVQHALRTGIVPDPEIQVIVPNSRQPGILEHQLRDNNQPHVVIGHCDDCPKWSHIKKLKLLLDGALATSKPYVMALDAFDVCLAGDLAVLKRALIASGRSMLISADQVKWPASSPGNNKINCGTWIARREYAIDWLRRAVLAAAKRPDVLNDQYWYNALCENWHIDYPREFFCTELRPTNLVNDYFPRAYLINLARRQDRMQRCHEQFKQWPFVTPQLFVAVDGNAKGHDGRWGCQQSHVCILNQSLAEELSSVLVLEDDFVFCPDFPRRVAEFLNVVPDDWELLWLGGTHKRPPVKVNSQVMQVKACVLTHCYAVRGHALARLRDFWSGLQNEHIDNALAHEDMLGFKVYCPANFLVGQGGGLQSNISGQTRFRDDFWSAFNAPRDRRRERLAQRHG